MIPTLLFLPALLSACHRDKDDDSATIDTAPPGWAPDLACPGDAGCERGDGALSAGAAKRAITPTCFETWEDLDGNGEYDASAESYFDCGCDQLCEGDEGWPGADDGEADGTFQAVWMAGFQNGRPATGVHDDLWARAVALRQGDVTVALVSLDVVGYFNDEVLDVRQEAAAAGLDVDHIIISSTHVHEGPDTMGLWGRNAFQSGVDPTFMAYIRSQVVAAVGEALDALEPATLRVGQADTSTTSSEKGTRNVVRDSRAPVIVDETLYAARLTNSAGDTIATLVNWGNHPEALSDENTLITSDYVHYVREAVENGVDYESYDLPGLGGVCVYLSAAVGGLMTPLGIQVTDGDGDTYGESNWDKAQALGNVIGQKALEAIEGGEDVADPALALRYASFYVPVENVGLQALALSGVVDRDTYLWDDTQNVTADNKPHLLTEVDVLDLGPVRMLTVPGELFPELAIGGYDGSHVNTTVVEFISSDNPNPPDISAAPTGPYLKDRMGATYNWVLGLGNDEIGYIVPPYDFELDENAPYLSEADGDHYEETNSMGPETANLIDDAVAQLLAWER